MSRTSYGTVRMRERALKVLIRLWKPVPRFDSTHEYFETSKDEHLTPSELRVLEIVDFEVEISIKPLVNYNG